MKTTEINKPLIGKQCKCIYCEFRRTYENVPIKSE